MRKAKKQYIPKIGDRVKLIELSSFDAFYDDWKRKRFLNSIFIINAIHTIENNLFPFVCAEACLVESDENFYFFAAKFEPAQKPYDTIKKWWSGK